MQKCRKGSRVGQSHTGRTSLKPGWVNTATPPMWWHVRTYAQFSSLNCISPNVGRYFGLVTGPPPPPMEAMEAMEAEATERFRRERSSVANLTRINLIFNLRHRRSEVTVFSPFCLLSCQTQSVLQDMIFGRNVCVFVYIFIYLYIYIFFVTILSNFNSLCRSQF